MIIFALNLPPYANKIKALPEEIRNNIFHALEDGMKIAEGISQKNYLTGPRPEKLGVVTGLLRSRVKSWVKKGVGGIFAWGILGVSGVVYAWIHELGGKTSPHIIAAKNKAFLVFFWQKKQVWMKIRSVNHPGSNIPARPFAKPALVDALPQIKSLLDLAVMKAYSAGGKVV